MRTFLTLTLYLVMSLPGWTQNPKVVQIQKRFEAAKPDEKSLGFYSLDWAMNLKVAKERSLKENRPILLILNTNITAGTNFFSGHT